MKGKLNWMLLQKKGRIVVRTVLWGVAALCIGIAWTIEKSASSIKEKKEAFDAYLALADSVLRLNALTSDSLLAESIALSGKGVLLGWEGAALWLETVQSYCRDSKVGMEYRIDSLETLPEATGRLRLLPLRFTLTSRIGEFETVMRLLEKICGDTAAPVLFTSLEMTPENTDYLRTSATVYRWIEL